MAKIVVGTPFHTQTQAQKGEKNRDYHLFRYISHELRREAAKECHAHMRSELGYRWLVANSSLSICRRPAIVKAPFSLGDVVGEVSPFVLYSNPLP